MAPINIDGSTVQDITIDGTAVQEVTIDGSVAWTAGVNRTIDSIEDADIAEYTGDTTQFTPSSQTFAPDGSYVLNGDDASGGYFQIISLPGEGLGAYPQRGQKFKFYFRSSNAAATKSRGGCIFASDSTTDNMYVVYIRVDTGDFQIREYVNGALNTYGSVAVSFSGSTNYEIVVDFDTAGDGTVAAEIYDDTGTLLNSTSITSTHVDSGAFGWFKENNGSVTYTDYAHQVNPYPILLEDWESGNHNNWPSGNQGFTVTSDTSMEGSYNLQDGSSFDSLFSFAGDGLPEYYRRGEALAYDMITDTADTATAGLYYGAVDTSNTYFTRYDGAGNLELVEKVGGTNTTIKSNPVSIPANTRLTFELYWDDGNQGGVAGDMLCEIYDNTGTLLGSTSGNSTSVETSTGANGEGLGWWQNDGTVAKKYDYLRKLQW